MTWLRSHRHHEPESQPEGDGPASEPELLTPHPNTPGGLPGRKPTTQVGLKSPFYGWDLGEGGSHSVALAPWEMVNPGPTPCAGPVFTSSRLILSVAPSQSTGPGWGSRLQSPQALQTQSGGRKWEMGRRNQELGLV